MKGFTSCHQGSILSQQIKQIKVRVEFLIFQQKHSTTYSILCFLWLSLFWGQCFKLSFGFICLLFVWSSPCPHQHIHKGPEQSLQVVAIISLLRSFEGASSCIKVLHCSLHLHPTSKPHRQELVLWSTL